MKKIQFILLLLFAHFISFSQNDIDTLIVKSDAFNFGIPIRDGNNVTYEFIISLDSNFIESEIYENFKVTLSLLNKNSGIDLNAFQLFKIYATDPLLFEDKNSNRFIYQLKFKTIKKIGEPDAIVSDLIYFFKIDVRVKGNRMKIIIKDIDLYFQSLGAAILVGPQSSLFKFSFNGLHAEIVGNYDGSDAVINNGIYKTKNYMAKRIYTVDYKLKNVIINYLISELKKNIHQNNIDSNF